MEVEQTLVKFTYFDYVNLPDVAKVALPLVDVLVLFAIDDVPSLFRVHTLLSQQEPMFHLVALDIFSSTTVVFLTPSLVVERK